MENTHTKTILMGMMFLSSGLCHNAVQALSFSRVFYEKQPSSFEQSLDDLGKGRIFRRQPTQKGYFHWVNELTPDYVGKQLEQAVYNKKPDTVQKILLLNRIFSRLDIQEDNLIYLLHIAIQNNDLLTLAALVNARCRDESGTEKPLFDINFEYNGRTPVMLAIWYRRTEMIDFLIREGADPLKVSPEGTALHFAIEVDDFDSITKINQYLLNGGQPQKRKQFLNQPNASGETIFHIVFRKVLKEQLSLATFAAILFWVDDFDFCNANKQEEIFGLAKNLKKILISDGKWYKFFKKFKISQQERHKLLQLVNKVLAHMCK
jgi:hypothetical protein